MRFLSQAIALEEGRPPRGAMLTILVGVTLFGMVMLWSSMTQVEKVAMATGQVAPQLGEHSTMRCLNCVRGGNYGFSFCLRDMTQTRSSVRKVARPSSAASNTLCRYPNTSFRSSARKSTSETLTARHVLPSWRGRSSRVCRRVFIGNC